MGQELVRRSDQAPTGLWSTKIMIDQPGLVSDIHNAYFAAGAQVATTNSYAIHRDRLRPAGIESEFENLHVQACTLACRARDAHGAGLVAGSLGPLGWSYSHEGAPAADVAAELYDEICRIKNDLVDLFIIETIASIEQIKGALAGVTGHGRPVWLALSVDDKDGNLLRSGETLQMALAATADHAPNAMLINCSVPEAVSQALPSMTGAGMPIGAYANGFTEISSDFLAKGSTVTSLSTRSDLTPDAYADHAGDWIAGGATIVGGCCEVGPAHIRELASRFA